MPLYDYCCPTCGNFRAQRRMAQSSEPHPCPGCAAPAPRRLLAPFLAGAGQAGGTSPHAAPAAGRANWRSLCGFGCSHCQH